MRAWHPAACAEGSASKSSATTGTGCERIVADPTARESLVWRRGSSWRPHRLRTARSCAGPRCPSPASRAGRRRFIHAGVAGLVRDETREPGSAPFPLTVVDRVVALTLSDPRPRDDPSTDRAIAAATAYRCVRSDASGRHTACSHTGYGASTVSDPAFAAKLRDVVGLCARSRRRTALCSRSTKSPRSRRSTDARVPIKKAGRTMTHDYIRTARRPVRGAERVRRRVIGQCMARTGTRSSSASSSGRGRRAG